METSRAEQRQLLEMMRGLLEALETDLEVKQEGFSGTIRKAKERGLVQETIDVLETVMARDLFVSIDDMKGQLRAMMYGVDAMVDTLNEYPVVGDD